MARIYFRAPQCLQCNTYQDRVSLRQVATLVFGVSILVLLVIFFVQSRIARTELSSFPPPQNLLPDSSVKTLLTYGPEVHYGIVLDCGSSGTRVYVYIWPPHSGNPQDLLNIQQLKDQYGEPVVKKVSPGLDTFASNPDRASDYLKPLLEFAADHIHRRHHKETFLYILATAGMRMIPEESQKAILEDLQRDIPKDFDFVISKHNFEVISGKQEGVYAWIAANYVLQKFGHGDDDHPLVSVSVENNQHVRRRTVGMIDMGGGSMQIAFEITSNVDTIPKHLIAEFNLGCQANDIEHTYRVYVTTFLGFGANEARSRYEQLLVSQFSQKAQSREKRAAIGAGPEQNLDKISSVTKESSLKSTKVEEKKESKSEKTATPLTALKSESSITDIPDPCLQQGSSLSRVFPQLGNITFHGTGHYHECKKTVLPLVNLTVPCESEPCSMNGVHQPSISFKNSEFYGFSEFWYTMEDVFRIGGTYEYDVFDTQAEDFCGMRWSTLIERYDKGLYKKADPNRFRMQCFKSAWMTTVLHEGLKFPKTYKHFTSVQFINKRDVQWTLGALIHRTRYLPLREIEQTKMENFKPSWVPPYHILYNEYLISLCFVIVVMAILLYVRRLKLCSKVPKTDLSRVPSMSYFMTEMDQVEQGVRFMKNYTYP